VFFDSKLLICLSTRTDQLISRHWHPQVKLSGRGLAGLPPAHQLVWVWTQNLFSGPRQTWVYRWAFTPRADSKSWGPLIWFCLIFSISWNLYTTWECGSDFFSHKMSWLNTVNFVRFSPLQCTIWGVSCGISICQRRLFVYFVCRSECSLFLLLSAW